MADTLQTELLARKWEETFGIDVRAEFHGVQQIEQRRCEGCSLVFFRPESVCGSAKLYEALDGFEWYYAKHRWEHDEALIDLKGRGRALEVGSGTGAFVRAASDAGNADVAGLEQNEAAVAEAKRLARNVRLGTVQEIAAAEPGSYDAVCSFQVLEHVPNPGSFLRACCDALRPGGLLALGLPNAKSFLRLQFNLLDMPPHHMSRWCETTLKRVAEIFPLRLRRIAYEPLAEMHVDSYVEAHSRILGQGKIAQKVAPLLKGAASRLLRASEARKALRGQAMYVAYERVSDR